MSRAVALPRVAAIDPALVEELAREIEAVRVATGAIAQARSATMVALGSLRDRPGRRAAATRAALVTAARALELAQEALS